uniref:SH3 domain-containing protein n=1 Tax=Echinococcus granulosus TaxID=6210 RepID=A0A068WRZ3_ECHGR|nr:hypothetical protein EgrG_001173800 [Echinococcus granulosus]
MDHFKNIQDSVNSAVKVGSRERKNPRLSGRLYPVPNVPVASRDSLKTKEDTILGQNIYIQHGEGVWAIGMAQKASPLSKVQGG